jgi:hypothetical protein
MHEHNTLPTGWTDGPCCCLPAGYVDDVHGIDLLGRCANNEYDMFGLCKQCAPSNDVGDVSGHGSHVAGIVAALQVRAPRLLCSRVHPGMGKHGCICCW